LKKYGLFRSGVIPTNDEYSKACSATMSCARKDNAAKMGTISRTASKRSSAMLPEERGNNAAQNPRQGKALAGFFCGL